MNKHNSTIANYKGSMSELAIEIGDLRYDALEDLLLRISEKIKNDGDKDLSRGRKKLAKCLHQSALKLKEASLEIKEAWTICEPYTK